MRFHRLLTTMFAIMLLLCCNLLLASYSIPEDFEGRWAGVDVLGTDHETAQKIKAFAKIPVGKKITLSDVAPYKSICQELNKTNLVTDSTCNVVIFLDGDLYFLIDVINKNRKKIKFREIPNHQKSSSTLPTVLNNLLDAHSSRLDYVFKNHLTIEEDSTQGYPTYSDRELNKISTQLAHHCPKYNNIVLDVLRYSNNPEQREKASQLLAWSQHPENLDAIVKWNILFDPDLGVRNYTARSYSSIMKTIKNKETLKMALSQYCELLTLPDHTDRNKAIYSISDILEHHPDITPHLDKSCVNTIQYLSEMSILENVGGKAKKVLTLIKKNSQHA